MASQIAVNGCGMKAVYIYYPDTNTWILDNVVAPAPPNEEAQPSVPPTQDRGTDTE